MKRLILISLLILSSFSSPDTWANDSLINCSNPKGTVVWEGGQGSNLIRLTYTGFVTGELELPLEQVEITMSDEKNIYESGVDFCHYSAKSRTFTARVSITPSPDYPQAFQSYFPRNRVDATVLCEQHIRLPRVCTK